ncbi:MAG TPA: glycine cleavage T C-terminal barrel domain-containing protein [Actinomycetota bacterium]
MQPFDMTLVQCGARLRRSPFFEAEQRYGPLGYTVYNHTLFPIRYDDLEKEYWHLLNHVTLWDVAVERQVEITGPDAFRFTSMLTPRDLSTCAVGQGKYVLITSPKGGIVNDPVLLRLGENHFWLALADSDVLLYAMGLAAHAGMDVEIGEPDVSPLQIQGPKSKEVVSELFGEAVLDLRYYHFLETELDGIPVVVTRTGWTAEVGYELYLRDGSKGTELWERIMEAGRPHDIRPTGPSDIRRVEAGILNHGCDMTLANNPFEVGLERLVDLDKKEEFMGREALRRIHDQGVARKLVGVEIRREPLAFNDRHWPVSHDGAQVGLITSALWSPRLEKNIGYAWLPADLAGQGTELVVATAGGDAPAVVVPMPFVDPSKEIPKA